MNQIFRRAAVRSRILGNPIGSVLRQYVEHLVARGHRRDALHQYVFAAEHFGRWLGRKSITHVAVGRFIASHLPDCRCEKPAVRCVNTVRAALNRLLEMRGVSRPDPIVPPAVRRILRGYEDHLHGVCGLAGSTIRYRLRDAREVLDQFEVGRVSQMRSWVPSKIADYVATAGRRCKPSSGQVLASSIRSFLRFLLLHGLIRRDLAAAVPSFANWRLAALPAVVDRSELEKLLSATDATTFIGMRDRGVLLCMTDLGLRASDVAAITTDGFDATTGILRIKHPKDRRVAELPMTKRLTKGLEHYLRRGRPRCPAPQLFVSHRAPVGRPLKPMGILGVVLRCAARAGLGESIRGTHVIRHSVASSLINAGASIKQIADLLGHRTIDTTAIYAKVDLRSLKRVAMPWPVGP